MPTWNSDQYLRFARERTRPAEDLAARVEIEHPARIVDLGCGPGNSTAVIARRWPDAAATGVDSSPAMLAAARRDYPTVAWQQADIATWTADAPFDVVFTNAALQWVPDHAALLPRLFAQVAPGGAFAMQVPADIDALPHRLMRELAASPAWHAFFATPAREWHTQPRGFYYDTLAPLAARIDLWETFYSHILESPTAIAEWYRGTGLRPWLDLLPDDATRERFVADYVVLLEKAFPRQTDGRILFPFHRLFLIAYRAAA